MAMGSIVLSPGVAYKTSSVEVSGAKTESNQMLIDGRLGYVLPMGLYVGGMYSILNQGDEVDSNGGHLMGPSIGYYSMMGFYTLLTYHILGEMDTSSTQTLTGGKGPQIDIGWVFPISSFFAIGPQMSYRSVEFDKVENSGVSTDTDYKATTIQPYLSLWFMF